MDRLLGIDLYDQDAPVDFEKLKESGIGFVILRCYDGRYGVDPKWIEWSQQCASLGIPVGPYTFFHVGQDFRPQVEATATAIRNAGVKLITPSFDVEWDVEADKKTEEWGSISQADRITKLGGALSYFEQVVQRKPMLYAGKSFFDEFFPGYTGFAQYPLWVADYHHTPPQLPTGWTQPVFWQWTGSGKVAGHGGDADLNYLWGDPGDLHLLIK